LTHEFSSGDTGSHPLLVEVNDRAQVHRVCILIVVRAGLVVHEHLQAQGPRTAAVAMRTGSCT
jgi:hypothetical protein